MVAVHTIREHESLTKGTTLSEADVAELREAARIILKLRDGDLTASKYVGIVTTRRGAVLEILPKIDLDDDSDHELTRRVFLRMLRRWRGLGTPLRQSEIRALSQYPMLEVFVRQFLEQVTKLARRGLSRRYADVAENLPYLRGRVLFPHHIRENAVNQARLFVVHGELTVDRPANRLIRSALERLVSRVREPGNLQLLRQAILHFDHVPQSAEVLADWQRHHVDRSMPHYRPVMQWVGLFLFNHGLSTFSGTHENLSLLFPMERVFEHFVTDSFRRYQQCYDVKPQGPQRPLTTVNGHSAFMTKPDISLLRGGNVAFILDAKWKQIDATKDWPKYGIEQADLYQLHAYGAIHGCTTVALVYPRNRKFGDPLHYHFFDGMQLLAIPFDVAHPEQAVAEAIERLEAG